MGRSAQMRCSKHGGAAGFITCIHVMDKTAVAHQVAYPDANKPGPEGLGELVCESCGRDPQNHIKEMRLVCERCAVIHGLIPH
jgi:hypothetical protein